jgi:hypothetical protein
VTYPDNDFAQRLAALAAMLAATSRSAASRSTRPAASTRNSNQASSLGDDIQTVCDALLAFQRDLEARGIAGRVLTQVWSEFGGAPSRMTPAPITARPARPSSSARTPRASRSASSRGSATLDDGDNLFATADFRAVYCSLLEQWFGVDAAPIIPGRRASRGRRW